MKYYHSLKGLTHLKLPNSFLWEKIRNSVGLTIPSLNSTDVRKDFIAIDLFMIHDFDLSFIFKESGGIEYFELLIIGNLFVSHLYLIRSDWFPF